MNKIIGIVVVLVAFMAGIAQAQQSPKPVNSWVFGVDFAPGGWVHSDGLQPFGSAAGDKLVADQKKDPLVTGFIGYKPLGNFGGEFRTTRFGTSGQLAGSADTVMVWGVDVNPLIVSSAPYARSQRGYSTSTSSSFQRMDFVVNRNWGFDGGWASVFGGLAVASVSSSEEISQEQKFLLYAKLPNGQIDPRGNREDYSWKSATSSNYRGVGPMFGVEGEYCIIGGVVIEGRVAMAILPWGSAKIAGQFGSTKNVYLVNVAGGVNATPIQTLASYPNWAADARPYNETVRQRVTALDTKVGIKWQTKVGKKASLNLGMAISRSAINNVSFTPTYVIKDPYAVGSGKYNSRTMKMSMWAPVITIGVWF